MVNFLFYLFSSFILVSGIMVISVRNPVHSVLFLIMVFFNAMCLLILLKVEFLALIFLVVYVGAIAILFLFVVMMLNIKIIQVDSDVFKYLPIGGLIGLLLLLQLYLDLSNDMEFYYNSTGSTLVSGVYSNISLVSQEYLNIYDFISYLKHGDSFFTNKDFIIDNFFRYKFLDNIVCNLFNDYFLYNQFTDWYLFYNKVSDINILGNYLYTKYSFHVIIVGVILLVAMIGAIVLTVHNTNVNRQQIFQQVSRDFNNAVFVVKNL